MPSSLKGLESDLYDLGFAHSWKLVKEKDLPDLKDSNDIDNDFYSRLIQNTKRPLCQNVDVVVPSEPRNPNQFRQLLNIVGAPCPRQLPNIFNDFDARSPPESPTDVTARAYKPDDQRREDTIQEFISSEESYVETLRTIVEVIARPLRAKSSHERFAVINQFKCNKIFLNIEQILEANEKFIQDLRQYNASSSDVGACFGDICATHMNNFECYRKYLHEYREAQKLHTKEFRSNQAYRSFLIKAKDDPRCKRRGLQDLLVQPPQRITRYVLLLKDILQFTPRDHRDFIQLTMACAKSSEIATMADDDPTKVATLCHNLYISVKDSPCSLVNQNRSLLACVDAIEVHRDTNKPRQAVTIFLFNDKLMVTNRPSHNVKGIDLCGLDGNIPDSSGSLMRGIKREQLKFKGWIDIEQVELFNGASDRPSSFLLRAKAQIPDSTSTVSSFEKYFHKGPRLYTFAPPSDDESEGQPSKYFTKAIEFISLFQRAHALAKECDENDKTFYRTWDSVNVYSNIHSLASYSRSRHKNNIAVVYIEEDATFDIRSLFRETCNSPWIVALVQGDSRGFRFSVCSRVPLTVPHSRNGHKTSDFECIFWNNIILCERNLRCSQEFAGMDEVSHGSRRRSRSRSRSLPRSASIPTLGKLFSSSRSRSTSPSRHAIDSNANITPTSSRSSPIQSTNTGRVSPVARISTLVRKPVPKDRSMRPRATSMTSLSSLADTLSSSSSPPSITARSSRRGSTAYKGVGAGRKASADSVLLHEPPRPNKICTNHIDQFAGSVRRDDGSGGGGDLSPLKAHIQTVYASLSREHELSSSPTTTTATTLGPESRPSSRSSTRSSTPSLALSNGGNCNHAGHHASGHFTVSSMTSQSTRSSVSLEELEYLKYSPPPPRVGIAPEHHDDEISRKVQELLAFQKKFSPKPLARQPPPPAAPDNGFIVSPVHQQQHTSPDDSTEKWNQLIDKCRVLGSQITRMTEHLQANSPDFMSRKSIDNDAIYNRFNANLDEIATIFDNYRNTQQHRRSQVTAQPDYFALAGNDAETQLMQRLKEAQAERDYWQRRASDLKNQIVEYSRQGSTL